ncbi:hypothetical protein SAY86_019583 [Trapa natans]|uniref:Uncharacterized protein n=1 Tax=Trapa natans TaxID=22666 RepID=A0AAN7LP65_TRANT|nr:hypothetical protein SAY86_019583 [Trapa natans]
MWSGSSLLYKPLEYILSLSLSHYFTTTTSKQKQNLRVSKKPRPAMGSSQSGGQSTTEKEYEKLKEGATAAVLLAVGAAAVGWMAWGLFSKGDGRKTMKAPGRSTDRIFRDEFEKDPATYFRDLRKP